MKALFPLSFSFLHSFKLVLLFTPENTKAPKGKLPQEGLNLGMSEKPLSLELPPI